MMNFPIAIYNRERPNRFLAAVSPILAVILTLALGGAIFAMVGKEPLYSLYVFCVEPLLTLRGWGELGVKMTPLILCALGLVVCYRANIWNIGAEGQLIIGALCGGYVALQASPGSERALHDLGDTCVDCRRSFVRGHYGMAERQMQRERDPGFFDAGLCR